MSFVFFTFGGQQLWEDVFVYKKWRIQRNIISKTYRVLDAWDIRRANGSFDACWHYFERCIKIFQIPTPNQRVMVMIHGLGGQKNQFKKLSNLCESLGYEVVAINYPSTRKNIDAFIRQFDFLLNRLDFATEFSFIAYGLGGLLLHNLLISDAPWRQKKIDRIILINFPNRRYPLLDKLAKLKFLQFCFGPLLKFFNDKQIAPFTHLPQNINYSLIYANNRFAYVLSLIAPKKWKHLFVKQENTHLANANHMITFDTWSINPLNSKKVILACKNLLLNK